MPAPTHKMAVVLACMMVAIGLPAQDRPPAAVETFDNAPPVARAGQEVETFDIDDQKLLQGTWECVATLRDGQPVNNYIGVRAVIEGDRLTWHFPRSDGTKLTQVARFKLDQTQNPRHLDWWDEKTPEKIHRRLYSLDGDTWKMADHLTGTRPTSFAEAKWQFTSKRIAAAAAGTLANTTPTAHATAPTAAPPAAAPPTAAPAVADSAAGLAAWGQKVDPLRDCQFEERGGALSIRVPGSLHDLVAFANVQNTNAPRLMRDADGDFTLEVCARKFDVPYPKTAVSTDKENAFSYVSSGLVIWQDERTFIRLQRAANGDSGRTFIHLNQFSSGAISSNSNVSIDNEDAYLRVERKAGQFTMSHSRDGRTWTVIPAKGPLLTIPGKVRVGVFVINATNRAVTHEFTSLRFARSGGGSSSPQSAPPAAATNPNDGFKPLVDGATLAGWTPIKTSGAEDDTHAPAQGGWEIRGGELVCTTRESGWLKLNQPYGDFELELEYKLPYDGNTGVYIRSPDSGQLSRTGIEVQLVDEESLREINSRGIAERRTGALFGIVGPSTSVAKPAGQWNTLRIRCEGPRYQVTVNGSRVVDADASRYPALASRPRFGFIGLQNSQGRASGTTFRNIRIKSLSIVPR